jgi:ribosomal protein L40E
MVNGVCQLDKSSGGSIPPLYIAGGAAAIGAAIIGIIFAVKRGSGGTSTPKPARQDLDDYESQYLARQGQRPSPKPAETRQTSSFCDSCGTKLKPTAKFCGKCGNKVL